MISTEDMRQARAGQDIAAPTCYGGWWQVITITSQDLLTIYLSPWRRQSIVPAISACCPPCVGSGAGSRLGCSRMTGSAARNIDATSMLGAGFGRQLALPISCQDVCGDGDGFSLGIATTLSPTNVVDLASRCNGHGYVTAHYRQPHRSGRSAAGRSLVAAAAGVGASLSSSTSVLQCQARRCIRRHQT